MKSLGITAERLLLPIDLANCPLEVFPLAARFTRPVGGEIVLLHVLDRRPGRGQPLAGELEHRRAERHLRRLGRDHLRFPAQPCFRVRAGIPHEEIVAEASAQNADLILLPVFAPSIWRRMVGCGYGATARSLVARASCRIFVVDVRRRFNCLRRWAVEEAFGLCAT